MTCKRIGKIFTPSLMKPSSSTKEIRRQKQRTGGSPGFFERRALRRPMATICRNLLGTCLPVFLMVALCGGISLAQENGIKITNEMIYQKLLEMEKTQAVFGERFEQIDKRFELVDKRFEQIDKRFEQIEKRFEQIDKRFEQIDKKFEQLDRRISDLREDTNNRFLEFRDDMNKRFEQLFTFLWIITGIFTTFTVAIFGFAWWDRKTVIIRAKQESVEEVEKKLFSKLLNDLKDVAKDDKRLAEALKFHGLL